MFIVSLTYICDLNEIDRFLDEHVAYLKEEYALGHFLISGRNNPRTGGIILAKTESREELDAILAKDPFHREKLAKYDIQEFIPTMAAAGLESMLE
ncbi:YciI family protein [uncultured Pseudodesulfovibrio sp.]|uniref:YciI family protein n=1 Tax=uncultured Pseudodesulfovibrio sp. TaxID=2035858 RepID=UPI0029C7E731|nr:YciI family protein [uncultured Pseudodesulfovibrio sp.]